MEGDNQGWTDEVVDAWVDKWMDELTDLWMNEWMHEWMEEWIEGWMDEWMNWFSYRNICVYTYVCNCVYIYVYNIFVYVWMYSVWIIGWTNKNLDVWNRTQTKSCLMVGIQKLRKLFKNIIVFYTLYRGPQFKKIRFFEKNACFTAPIFSMFRKMSRR